MSSLVDETSNREKLEIAQHFLLSSPPGQFNEVLTDVRKLLPEGILSEQQVTGIARAFNNKTGRVVISPSGQKTVICSAGEADSTHYVDPNTKQIFSIDHITLQTTPASGSYPNIEDEKLSEKQKLLQTNLKSNLRDMYPSDDSAVAVFTKDGKIFVNISAEKINLRNFWSGRMFSSWTIVMSPTHFVISGEIKIHAHYFEDGNVQLQSMREFPSLQITYSSDADLSTAVQAHIKESEKSLQAGLQDMYLHMNEETFRAMRRLMPVTRSKMEWNINAVRMVKQTRK